MLVASFNGLYGILQIYMLFKINQHHLWTHNKYIFSLYVIPCSGIDHEMNIVPSAWESNVNPIVGFWIVFIEPLLYVKCSLSTYTHIQDIHNIVGLLLPYNHECPKWGLIQRDRVMQLMKQALYLQATTAGCVIKTL